MDLISGQNVLICFGPELQKRVIRVFHFALQPQGFLPLSSSESVHGFRAYFTRADKRRRLYAKTSPLVRPELIFHARAPGTDLGSAPAPELVLPNGALPSLRR
jgi:two-component system, chemotaxis family, CheB/CheR fusion protein